jgi:hypothetical protein
MRSLIPVVLQQLKHKDSNLTKKVGKIRRERKTYREGEGEGGERFEEREKHREKEKEKEKMKEKVKVERERGGGVLS